MDRQWYRVETWEPNSGWVIDTPNLMDAYTALDYQQMVEYGGYFKPQPARVWPVIKE